MFNSRTLSEKKNSNFVFCFVVATDAFGSDAFGAADAFGESKSEKKESKKGSRRDSTAKKSKKSSTLRKEKDSKESAKDSAKESKEAKPSEAAPPVPTKSKRKSKK